MDSARVLAEPLMVALPKAHRLAAAKTISAADFADEPFIMYAPYEARYFHDLVADFFATAGVEPRYVQHLTQIHSMLALVRSGLGAALVPETASNLQLKDVVLRELAPPQPRLAHLFLVWRRDNNNPLLPIILDIARAVPKTR
jgi:DNA-binding transcriptional LysR family regulator